MNTTEEYIDTRPLNPEVYRATADTIERMGWWAGPGSVRFNDTEQCAGLGIINCPVIDTSNTSSEWNADPNEYLKGLGKWLGFEAGHTHLWNQIIFNWNDTQPDAETVITKLRQFAEFLETGMVRVD